MQNKREEKGGRKEDKGIKEEGTRNEERRKQGGRKKGGRRKEEAKGAFFVAENPHTAEGGTICGGKPHETVVKRNNRRNR